MGTQHSLTEKFIEEFSGSYIDKIFYFCLKKTGDSYEAEDLTSDISLNVLKALAKGTIPTSFSAWVWQIARNRYSVWADKKHKKSESVTGSDIGDYEIEDKNADILNELIFSEQLALLRRELAFISSDYRNIVVAYYLENRKVSDIAATLNLPAGTVTSKLFRARKILKEGMNMAREFGKLSYNPENVSFIMNGMIGKNGEPWCYLTRMLCKNIMLAAYRNPSTAEELAVEVGVALPYMEEELGELVNATLMKKNGNKYETNFFIVSAEAQEKIYAHLRGITPELTQAIIAATEHEAQWLNENAPGWHEGYQDFEDMKWALLMAKVDTVNDKTLSSTSTPTPETTKNLGNWGHTIRPGGGEWDILGSEIYSGPQPKFVGLCGCYSNPSEKDFEKINFYQYMYEYKQITKKTPSPLTYAEGQALAEIAKGNAANVNEVLIGRLIEYGYVKETPDGYQPTFLVISREKGKKMPPENRAEYQRLLNRAKEIATKHYLFCRDVICNEIPDFLKNDPYQIDHACANIFTMRGAVLEEALRLGYISYDENDEKRMLGAFLKI